jgi:aurora kinase
MDDVEAVLRAMRTHFRDRSAPTTKQYSFLDKEENVILHMHSLSHGSFGWVYAVTDSEKNVVCAVKMVECDPSEIETHLPQEIEIGMSVQHRHICETLGYEFTGNYYIIAMDYVDAGDLMDMCEEGAYDVPEEDKATIIGQLADALLHMHMRGYVHIDVKPENVLMDDDDFVLLCDFGLSRAYHPSDRRRGGPGGTTPYMAPEMHEGNIGAISPAADAWSLGCVLLWMYVGDEMLRDVDRDSYNYILDRDYERELPNREVADLLHRMLMRDPTKRIDMIRIMQHPWITRAHARPLHICGNEASQQQQPPTHHHV